MKERESSRPKPGRVHDPPETEATGPGGAISQETESIRAWLKKVRFRKTLFGGVNEADVWKKIAELNKLYETALAAERMRYNTLLAEAKQVRASGGPMGEVIAASAEDVGDLAGDIVSDAQEGYG